MDHYMEILKQFGVVMTVAGVIIGIIMSFVVFFVFMSKKNVNRFHGFFGWLYDYLQFKNFIIEGLLKFFYVLGACVCTTVGVFNILCLQMVLGFAVLIFGNLVLRILYEFALMIVVICRNVSEINKKWAAVWITERSLRSVRFLLCQKRRFCNERSAKMLCVKQPPLRAGKYIKTPVLCSLRQH